MPELKGLLEKLPAAAYACDAAGLITSYNERAAQMWGREPALHDPVDRYCGSFRLLSADGSPLRHEDCWMAKALREQRQYDEYELIIERPDGTLRHALAHANPFYDDAGRLAGAINVLEDVTLHKQAVEELRERSRLMSVRAGVTTTLASERSLAGALRGCCEAMVDHLEVAFARIWILNERDQMLRLQASAGLYTHLDGKHSRVRVGEFKIGRIAQSAAPFLTNDALNDPNVSDPEWAKREGMLAFAGYPLLFESRVLGVMAVFARRPLAEVVVQELAPLADLIALQIVRRRSVAELMESETKLRITLDSIGDGVITTDASGFVTRLNPIAEALTGWRSDEAEDTPIHKVFRVIDEETRKPIAHPVFQALTLAQVADRTGGHALLVAKDGVERPVDETAAPIRSKAGETLGCVLVFRDETERRRHARALQESERFTRRVLDSLFAFVGVMLIDGTLVEANRAPLEGAGIEAGDVLGKKFWDCHWWNYSPESQARLKEATQRALRGEIVRYDAQIRMAGESLLWIDFQLAPLRDGEGRITHLIPSGMEIESRKQAEETRERLAAIVESSDDAIVGRTLDGIVTSWNRGATSVFGYTAEEMIGRPVSQIIPLDRRKEAADILNQLIKDGAVDHFETTRIRRDGSEVDVSLNISSVKDAHGRIIGAAAIGRDITAAKKAERALRESEDRYRTLFESIAEGFCVIQVLFEGGEAVDYRYQAANPAFLRQTGMVDVVGKTAREIVPGVEPTSLARYGRVAATGETERFESVSEDMRRSFEVEAFRVGAPNESKVALLFSDITERKQAEEMLREDDRRKDEFLAMLSHELRNPLAPIRSGIEILKTLQGNPVEQERVRGEIERQTDQLVTIVDDLLDVSRITRGKFDLRRTRVAVSDVVRRAVETCRGAIDARDHKLQVKAPSEELYIDADPHRMTQVVSNLLNNAAKYTPPKGCIHLIVERRPDALVLRVKDNGVGIQANMRERIFDMFTQGENTGSDGEQGLGIGLTLVKSLVSMHGGSIEVVSGGAGQGSEFCVTLPRIIEMPTHVQENDPQQGHPRARGRRVLVVDDNRAAAEMLSLVVANLGHEVKTAFGGAEAVAAAEEFLPEVVLMDLGMPHVSGYEAAVRIRRARWGRKMKLVAVTGWGQEKDRRRTREGGFDGHLVKPASGTQIGELLDGL